jgi:inner membrane protein
MLKRLAVHPIQYSLVGAALALFYLLLLSFSEHIGFGAAYVLSSTACVLLIGFYVSGILRSARHGLGFGAMLTLLYGVLYGLLSADDYALLMGSILLFGLLAAVMVLTREVDWGSLRGRSQEQAADGCKGPAVEARQGAGSASPRGRAHPYGVGPVNSKSSSVSGTCTWARSIR